MMNAPTVTEQNLNDLTCLIIVDYPDSNRYYWHLGYLTYSHSADHAVRMDVVSSAARNKIKQIIDEALGYNVSMPESNEEALKRIHSFFA